MVYGFKKYRDTIYPVRRETGSGRITGESDFLEYY